MDTAAKVRLFIGKLSREQILDQRVDEAVRRHAEGYSTISQLALYLMGRGTLTHDQIKFFERVASCEESLSYFCERCALIAD